MHCTCRSLLTGAFGSVWQRPTTTQLPFLLPSLAIKHAAPFTSSAVQQQRRPRGRRDHNPWRGVSALRRTGINLKKTPLSVKLENLPQPVLDPARRSKVLVDDNHGLWEFFNPDRTTLTTPLQVASHGRGWLVQELRNKDWEDLHRLWWVCIKERNRLATESRERSRLGSMYGEAEETDRNKEIWKTMKSIKHVLTERFYAWENARVAAMDDPEVDLTAEPQKGAASYLEPEPEPTSPPDVSGPSGSTLSTSLPPSDTSRTEARV